MWRMGGEGVVGRGLVRVREGKADRAGVGQRMASLCPHVLYPPPHAGLRGDVPTFLSVLLCTVFGPLGYLAHLVTKVCRRQLHAWKPVQGHGLTAPAFCGTGDLAPEAAAGCRHAEERQRHHHHPAVHGCVDCLRCCAAHAHILTARTAIPSCLTMFCVLTVRWTTLLCAALSAEAIDWQLLAHELCLEQLCVRVMWKTCGNAGAVNA